MSSLALVNERFHHVVTGDLLVNIAAIVASLHRFRIGTA